MELNNIYNCDCLDFMKTLPNKCIDLCLTDPPYGIARFGNRVEVSNRICKEAKINKWDIKPEKEVFEEIFRVSRNQIIWGMNNFTLPQTEYFIVWDKFQTVDNFASAELAWTNIKKPAQVFRYTIHQEMQERKTLSVTGKQHPTQKPVKLGEWILEKYAKEGDIIFDPFAGSGTFLVSAQNLGFDYLGCELDKDYFEIAEKRLGFVKQRLF